MQVDGAVHLGAVEVPGRGEAEVGEEPQHLVVVAEGVGGEGGDAVGPGGRDEVLDEQGSHAPVVQAVGDRDGEFGGVRRVGVGVVLDEAEDLSGAFGEQGPVSAPGRRAHGVRGQTGGAGAGREEAQAAVVR